MKFCPVVPEICRGQVHASRKERIRIIIIKIKIIIRNGAKTISLQTFFDLITRYDYNLTIMKSPNTPLTLSTHISNFDDIGQC